MSFQEFWPYYLSQHLKPGTRALHFAGTTLALLCIAGAAALSRPILLVWAPVLAYGLAWTGHFFVEKNSPATFKYPVHSLLADFKMYGLMWAGALGPELKRLAPEIARHKAAAA